MKENRDIVFGAINEERAYQQSLWDDTGTQGTHSVAEFLMYIRDYTEEALHTLCREADAVAIDKGKHGLRKIAALAVAAMEYNGVAYRGYTDATPADKARHEIHT